MNPADLVRRNPEAWEYFSKRELSELGLVVVVKEDYSNEYAVVLWPTTGLSWDDPEDLLIVQIGGLCGII